jgi:hypothetical protein
MDRSRRARPSPRPARKLALVMFALFQLAALYGQAAEGPLAIGICATNALRIRSFPSLKEGESSVVGALSQGDELVVLGRLGDTITIDGISSSWYAVVGMDGAVGWSFGGYIDAGSAKLRVFAGSDENLGTVESEGFDALASEGGSCRLLRLGGIQAVFTKTAKGRPQVVYLKDQYTAYTSVVSISSVDYFGDASKELCIQASFGEGDIGEDCLFLYGRSAQENRYAAYGDISLGDFAVGDGFGMGSSSHVVEGPSPFVAGKNRCIRLVKEDFNVTPVEEDRGDGIHRNNVERKVFEELYALSGSKLVLFKKTMYSVDRTEEEYPPRDPAP